MGKFEHGFGTQLGAVLLWRGTTTTPTPTTTTTTITTTTTTTKGPFWKLDACSLEPPNNSCRKQKKRYVF